MKQDHIVIILSILLLLFLLWKEWKRHDRSFLAVRIIATITALSMLALVFIPITFTEQIQEEKYPKVLLITPGVVPTVDSFARYTRITTYRSKIAPGVQYIPDLSVYASQQHNKIPLIHIIGNGIGEQEWSVLNEMNIPVAYTAPPEPGGVIQIDWPRTLPTGDKLTVQGRYNNSNSKDIKLVLSGVGTAFDSITIKKDSVQTFSLSCQPAHTGNTIYELQITQEGQVLSSEKIPVTISASVRPKVLLLSSSPGFENKFLASWLYEHHYSVALRNTVSRGKYDHQFLNMKETSLNDIGPSLLQNFDLLIADDNSLSELSNAAAVAIKAQIQKGMGLIVQTDSSASLSSFSRSFALQKQSLQKTATRSLIWAGNSLKSPLSAEQWFSIRRDPLSQALVTDESQAVIVACRLYGSGKIVMNTANTTYGWMLAGNQQNYSSFWSLLLRKAARAQEKETVWRHTPGLVSVDQQVKLVLEKNSAEPPIIKTGSGELYTAQTPYLPDTWTANWWPRNAGWQTLSCTDTASIYVFEEKDWSAAKQYAQINNNRMYAAQQKSIIKKTTAASTETKTIPAWIFYIILVAACGFLWWEAKRGVDR